MEDTLIEWANHTFNPWFGCTEVSSECDQCYARVLMAERLKRCTWGKGATRIMTRPAAWRDPLRWNERAARVGFRARVFCASLADVFDEEVDDEWRDRLFGEVVSATPNLDWLLLTKRPGKASRYLEKFVDPATARLPPNWWVGVTVGVQASTWRLTELSRIPARIRFVSAEPLLEQVDLSPWLGRRVIDWVIVGGESLQVRHDPRPMNASWARILRDQCARHGASFFFKQWGAYDEAGSYVGKKDVGRRLDGVGWSEIPR